MNKSFYKVWVIFSVILCMGWAYLCYRNYQKGNTAEAIITLILTVIFLIGFIMSAIIVIKERNKNHKTGSSDGND